MAFLFFPCREEVRLVFRRRARFPPPNRTTMCSTLLAPALSAASRVWESKVPLEDVDTPNTVRHGAASSSHGRG